MNPRTARRLVLPATLAVTTLLACRDPNKEPYCGDIEKQEDCEIAEHCGWNEQFNGCENTCYMIEDQAECEAIEFCVWDADYDSGSGGSDTGGGSSCHEPFT